MVPGVSSRLVRGRGFFTYAIARSRDRFVAAARTTAGTSEPGPVPEGEPAALAFRRFQEKRTRGIAGDCLYDVREVLFDLAFRNAHELGQLMRGQQCAGQQFDETLAGGAFHG